MSKVIKYTCDVCKKPITGESVDNGVGSGELCVLSYYGKMGHNHFPTDKHYHYSCFSKIVTAINKVEAND